MRHNQLKIFLILSLTCSGMISSFNAVAQTSTRKKIELFGEDDRKYKQAVEALKLGILGTEAEADKDIDLKAPDIEYDKDGKVVHLSGGSLISGNGVQAQSDSSELNMETKDAKLNGNVVFTGTSGVVTARQGNINMEDETGEFQDAQLTYEDGGYSLDSSHLFKITENRYKLFDPKATTCHCTDGTCPWELTADEASITKEGYAYTWDTVLKFHGVPIFYTPFFGFPAKLERASGLLAPSFGFSNKDGFKYRQPLFVVIDDSTDFTLSPFTESKTREGTFFDFRKSLAKNNNIESKIIYSNESRRGSDKRGYNTDGLVDPTIDTNRFAIYYNHIWKADSDAVLPFRFITDIHHVSDDLMIKEIPDDKIAIPESTYTTSSMLLRSSFGDYFSGEVLGEVNDPIAGPSTAKKTTFDKLPEASATFLKSFRPIENPYGLRLVTKGTLTETEFTRDLGYDGTRTSFNPVASIPFHVSNYLSGSLGGGVWARGYNLSNTEIPGSTPLSSIDGSQTSEVPYLLGGLGTVFERVYELPEDNILSYVTNMGTLSQNTKLVRVKNTIEPTIRYTLVPDISQGQLPLFDQVDRVNEKSYLLYGVTSTLYGKMIPKKDIATGMPQLTPKTNDFPVFDGMPTIPDYGMPDSLLPARGDVSLQPNEIRQILAVSLLQGYDWRREYRRQQELDQGKDSNIYPLTDLTTAMTFTPTKAFGLALSSYYNKDESRFTGYSAGMTVSDDRNDSLIARYSFIGPTLGNQDGKAQVDQVDGGIEGVLSERLRLGAYTSYDNVTQELISNRIALRILSSCDCWHLDIGYSDKTNPNKQLMYLSFTFNGLGDISQDITSWGETPSR